MGISGLIPFVSDAIEKVEVNKLRGKKVAIDSYCWLHKGAFGCAEKLAIGEKTTQYVKYCTNMLDMLLFNGVIPVMVFDGRHLPAKANEEKNRREERQKKKKLAAQFLRSGQKDKARKYIASSIDVTHEMALELIRTCRSMKIDSIVAPYEADAQLAYLNLNGFVDCVITEDSDLILFGCKKVLFKLQKTGEAQLYNRENLPKVMGVPEDKFDFASFRRMCILSGCDYLSSLPGIGLVKAKKVVLRARDIDITTALMNMGKYLNMPKLEVTDEYIEQFFKAEATFMYQYVYDPYKRKVVRLTEPPADISEDLLSHSGAFIEDEEAFKHALGNIDPFSKKEMDDWNPDTAKLWPKSIWQSNIKLFKKSENKLIDVKPAFQVTPKRTSTKITRTSEVLEETETEDIANEYKTVTQPIKKVKLNEKPTPLPSLNIFSLRNRKPLELKKVEPLKETTVSPESPQKKTPLSSPLKELCTSPNIISLKNQKTIDSENVSLETPKTPPSSPLKPLNTSPILNKQLKRKPLNSKFLTRSSSVTKPSESISSFFKRKSVPIIYSVEINDDDEDVSPSCSQKSECENDYVDNNIIVNTEKVLLPVKKVSPVKIITRRQGLSRNQINKNDTSQKLLTSFGFMKKPQLS